MATSTIYPSALTGTAAIAYVRAKTNAQTAPTDATIYTLLNYALEQVQRRLNLIYRVNSQQIGGNGNIQPAGATLLLPTDVQEILKVTFSTLLPTAAGTIEYPTYELGPVSFADATWNAPTISGGPTVLWRRVGDAANQITLQVYPTAPSSGYFNTYYKGRPALWDASTPATTPDLDSAYLRLAITHACMEVAEGKNNRGLAKYFREQYKEDMADALETAGRRQSNGGAMVRDVTNAPNVIASWWPS